METATVPAQGVVEPGKIRLAEVPPTHCSSCFGQYPDREHVDFGAAWDGPTFPPDHEQVAGGKSVVIDDLVVCDECLRHAAGLVGMVDPDDTARHIAQLELQAEELRERLHGATDYIGKLEAASEARGTLEARLTGGGA